MSERAKGSEGACDLIVGSIWRWMNPVPRPNFTTTKLPTKEQPTQDDEKSVVSLIDTTMNPSSGMTAEVPELHSKLKDRRRPKGEHRDGVNQAYSIILT